MSTLFQVLIGQQHEIQLEDNHIEELATWLEFHSDIPLQNAFNLVKEANQAFGKVEPGENGEPLIENNRGI